MNTVVHRLGVLAVAFLSGCGGIVVEYASNSDADVPKDASTPRIDAATATSPPPPSTGSATPVDAGPPPITDAGAVVCEEGPATGSPAGCGPSEACSAADARDIEWARAMLSCYVDRCAMEHTGKPWCGTISLTIGPDGCTADYVEAGDGAGGCVKYQGYYRKWSCMVGKKIEVTRPCP